MSVASVPQLLQEVETSKVFHWPTSAHSLVERLAAALEHTTVERDHACTLQTLAEEDRDALRAQREALVEALKEARTLLYDRERGSILNWLDRRKAWSASLEEWE